MSYDGVISIHERNSERDDSDRCKLCGSLILTETVTPEKGSPFQWVWCSNKECNNSKPRKVSI